MPQPRILTGSFWEDGPVTLYALLQRDDGKTNIVPGDVTEFAIRIYDLDGSTPDTAVWTKTGEDPTGVLTNVQEGVEAAPSGYNWKLQIGAGEADDSAVALTTVGGRKYRVSVALTSALKDVNGARVVWELDCRSVVMS